MSLLTGLFDSHFFFFLQRYLFLLLFAEMEHACGGGVSRDGWVGNGQGNAGL